MSWLHLTPSRNTKALGPSLIQGRRLHALRGTTLIRSEDRPVVRPFIPPLTEARRNLLLHVRRFGSEASSATSRLICTTHQLSSECSPPYFWTARVLLLVLALQNFFSPLTVIRRYEFDSIGGDSTFPMLFFPAAGATNQKTFSTGPINA